MTATTTTIIKWIWKSLFVYYYLHRNCFYFYILNTKIIYFEAEIRVWQLRIKWKIIPSTKECNLWHSQHSFVSVSWFRACDCLCISSDAIKFSFFSTVWNFPENILKPTNSIYSGEWTEKSVLMHSPFACFSREMTFVANAFHANKAWAYFDRLTFIGRSRRKLSLIVMSNSVMWLLDHKLYIFAQ